MVTAVAEKNILVSSSLHLRATGRENTYFKYYFYLKVTKYVVKLYLSLKKQVFLEGQIVRKLFALFSHLGMISKFKNNTKKLYFFLLFFLVCYPCKSSVPTEITVSELQSPSVTVTFRHSYLRTQCKRLCYRLYLITAEVPGSLWPLVQ